MKTPNDLLPLNPCSEGLTFAKQFSTLQEAWDKCENSSWMWWYLGKHKVSKEISVKYARLCANHVSHLKNYAAAAAYEAEATTSATSAANAAADAADVACCATADADAERKWQADQLRILVPTI